MSSFIMHIGISNLIKQKYDYGYEFLYGSISPDILSKAGENKDKVHYRTNGDYSLYEIDKFIKEKWQKEKSEYHLGYLAHLIQDKLLTSYINAKIKETYIDNQLYITYLFDHDSLHKKQEFLDLIHKEYAILDDYFIKKYDLNLDYLTKRITRINKEEKLEEILVNELKIHEISPESELKIFSILDIEQYIKECVQEFDRYVEEEL